MLKLCERIPEIMAYSSNENYQKDSHDLDQQNQMVMIENEEPPVKSKSKINHEFILLHFLKEIYQHKTS